MRSTFIKSTLFNSKMSLAFLLLTFLALQGCLQTREAAKEQEEKVVIKKQLTNLQQTSADTNTRFQDLEDEQRRLSGRMEAVEVKLQQTGTRFDKANIGVDAKLKEKDEAYREEFNKLHAEITQLKAQLAALHEEARHAAEARSQAEAAVAARAAEASKNPFAVAEAQFERKNWKEAAQNYDVYRSKNPKGKSYALASYKMGVCFQELGMADDAKAFYDEVIERFPGSGEAKKAASRLKALAKKKK